MDKSWFSKKNNALFLSIYAVPRASRSEIVGIYDNFLKIRLKAPPQDNKANKELISFLANKLSVPKKNIKIVCGFQQRKKIVSVIGKSVDAITALLVF